MRALGPEFSPLKHAHSRDGENVGGVAEGLADRNLQGALICGQRSLLQQIPQGLVVAVDAGL
jgi:hypothetical protein